MQSPEVARPRARSPFAAAFLSLLFPGLGHAYVGAHQRALAFAAPPLLILSLTAGLALRMNRGELFGLLLSNLIPILVLNVVVLVYRIIATVDAWRVAAYLNSYDAGGADLLGPPRIRLEPLPVAGLLAVLLVLSGAHVVVARYDLQALDFVNCVFDAEGTSDCAAEPRASPGRSAGAGASSVPEPGEGPIGTALPPVTVEPWNGRDRLNILLIGTDERPEEDTYNTDTLIVVSIDPVSKQVAMLSLPRDTVDVPLPPGPARSAFGPVYPQKINSFFTQVRGRADLFPGTNQTRGYNGLKALLGTLYGLDIKYYVEVNFEGFKKVIDALGGVTVNVQIPVVDDNYPGEDGRPRRVYIPAGIQHMDGSEALIYARSRHGKNGRGSDDFDRGARQQRVLLSLRQQSDPVALLQRIDQLVDALKQTVHTDIPVGEMPNLMGLAGSIDTRAIRSFVFAPPLYQREILEGDPRGYVIIPNVAKIRAAVDAVFEVDPAEAARREALALEKASVWVLNGTGEAGQASRIADYLEVNGITASAPNQRPDARGLSTTRILAYNGAETEFPATAAFLTEIFDVELTPAADPAVRTDFAITTAPSTPELTPPPGS
jgi:LCP family protein required for cell wall assembly